MQNVEEMLKSTKNKQTIELLSARIRLGHNPSRAFNLNVVIGLIDFKWL